MLIVTPAIFFGFLPSQTLFLPKLSAVIVAFLFSSCDGLSLRYYDLTISAGLTRVSILQITCDFFYFVVAFSNFLLCRARLRLDFLIFLSFLHSRDAKKMTNATLASRDRPFNSLLSSISFKIRFLAWITFD